MLDTITTQVVLNVRYAPIIPKFLELQRNQLNSIDRAIFVSDFETLKRLGHNLRGAGASYGLEALSNLGRDLEEYALDSDIESLYRVYARLIEFLDTVEITYCNSILFVDDQPEIVALLKRLFTNDEYICYFANSAEQALEILENYPVDVLVSDLVMPDMGGLELLGLVRQRYPQVVRMVLSGQAQVPSILAAIKTGHVFRYLTKPWRVDAEARETITEAVEFANESNRQAHHHLQVPVETLVHILRASGIPFVLSGQDNKVLGRSEELPKEVRVGRGDAAPAGALATWQAEKLQLDRRHTLWLLH